MNVADNTLLEGVAQALRGHSLSVVVYPDEAGPEDGRARTWLRVGKGRYGRDYAAAIRGQLVPSSLGAVLAQLRQPGDAGDPPPLLITRGLSAELAQRLREQEQQFADAAGNAYLEGPGLFVYVCGRKLNERQVARRTGKGFTTSRLKVLFALICDPELAAAPYRAIAAAADVALGALPMVINELQRDGSLVVVDRRRRLNAGKRLLDEWAHDYALGLRGRTLVGRYLAEHFDGWPDWPLNPAQTRWGGEPAARLLGCALQPGMLTIYGEKLPARLVAREHLAPARPVEYEHLVELRKPFWGDVLSAGGLPQTVAPALVYADLLATGNRSCIEAAQALYDQHLARRFPPA